VTRSRNAPNRVRIIGGAWRGRILHFPHNTGLRPTPDRVRETLFNWLGQNLETQRCLDLFAGSGALGFEALSRGAAEVVMVESSRAAHRALRANAARLGTDHLRLVLGDALNFLRGRTNGEFDVVFLDPPYGSGLLQAALERVPVILASHGRVYAESDVALAPPKPWRVARKGRAGAVFYQLLEWGPDGQGSLPGDV
jgi:16S rRNA (guanine966-N2)-methyltransferase